MPYKDPEQQRKYQREWYARRRAAYFADKHCVDCGSTEQLELDHVRGKKITHRIWSWSKKRREAELKKCEVRCRVCHKAKDDTERTKYITYEDRLAADAKRKREAYDPAARRRKYQIHGV